MQELVDKVWNNPKFQEGASKLQLAWLAKEFGSADDATIDIDECKKLMQAAAILACSEQLAHRKLAFRVATSSFELFGAEELPFDQALRVVLARLGNFPSIGTSEKVDASLQSLPLTLAVEEILASEARQIKINKIDFVLTDFQHQLWSSLVEQKRVAVAAPTSAGKSFVLQHYLASLFETESRRSVVYLVPSRALIAQVAEDLTEQFATFSGIRPDIITVPIDSESPLPGRAIYVMTQERVQLALNAHPSFSANVAVVDEAHTIADGARGILLQWVVDDLLSRNAEMQIMFASPTIRNLDVFGRLFGLENVHEFSSVEPTVAQNFLKVEIESATSGDIKVLTLGDGSHEPLQVAKFRLSRTLASRVDKLVHIAASIGAEQSNIIYADGAADAEKIAIQLADLFNDRAITDERAALADLAKEAVHPNFVLVECVKRGVAFHYSNIPTQLRRAIEHAVSVGHIDYLVCTSTLLQGVNLPVKNIFMCVPKKGIRTPLASTDFWNLAGRAGRLRKEFQGNIFLIDYESWKVKPLDGPRDSVVISAMENSVKFREQDLITAIVDDEPHSIPSELESAFVRLFSDHKNGNLARTLDRIGLAQGAAPTSSLQGALETASSMISIPDEILRRTPSVSAHKQQRLYDYFSDRISNGDDATKALIPLHPRETGAYDSYAAILKLCHEIIQNIDTSRGLHRFHALMALLWMQGMPLPQIIEGQLNRPRATNPRAVIRDTLETIETSIRFQTVRLIGCYTSLLIYALDVAGHVELAPSIPSLPLYLEVGASDKTMISFISLGLSRVTSMKLNDMSARKDLGTMEALTWLKTRDLETFGFSPLLLDEVRSITASKD